MVRPSTCSLAAIGAIALALGTVGAHSGPRSQDRNPFRILFIGNSLTAANNLPAMVEALGRAQGTVALQTTAVTAGNFSLEDHWKQGPARAAIAKGGWSVVVLQQGPSALPESRVLLRDYTKRFAADARKAGARTALYMVWPSQARARDFDDVSKSYALAAQDVDGLLLPAGDAWREAWRLDASLALYGSDGFHPSGLGSYLAALAVWRGLSRESVVGLPGPPGVSAGTLRHLQESADRAVTTVSASPRKEFAALR
jgi:hypothetical protein